MAVWPDSRRRVPGAVVLAATVAWILALAGEDASASHVSCGDTITTDTTLDSDLLDCPSNGIVIGADNITLDLDGHTVSGNGKPFKACPEGEFCDVGVLNNGHDGVTVRNGSVGQFESGVFVGRARDNRVLEISSSQNTSFGFFVFRAARSLVRDSSGSRNVAPDGDGMGLFESNDVRILRNSFEQNPGPGIHVADSSDNVIEGNRFSRNGPAILMEANGNQIRGNRVRRGGGILVAPGNRNVIAGNRVSRALDSITIEGGHDNRVARNVVVRSRRTGIRLGLTRSPLGGADNVVRRNLVRGSRGDGFLVGDSDNRSLLKRNIARRAGDDGFDIESSSTKLTGNRAVGNDDLGIEAVEGVISGGGNRARGNGDPRQCVNLRCR